jgi:hypothetical protein
LDFAVLTHVNRVGYPATMTISTLSVEDSPAVADLPTAWSKSATSNRYVSELIMH